MRFCKLEAIGIAEFVSLSTDRAARVAGSHHLEHLSKASLRIIYGLPKISIQDKNPL